MYRSSEALVRFYRYYSISVYVAYMFSTEKETEILFMQLLTLTGNKWHMLFLSISPPSRASTVTAHSRQVKCLDVRQVQGDRRQTE